MRKWISNLLKSVRPVSAASASRIETLEERRLCAGAYAYGINANSTNAGVFNNVVGMLKDTGTKSVRLWLGINNWSHNETGAFKYVRRYADAGFDVTLTVAPKTKASSETIRDYFSWAAGQLGSSVDRWQVGNEPDREQWRGNLDGYVTDMLRPAAAGLHARGEKVVNAGVSWNPDDVATMVNAGMLNYVDYVGYHPYTNNVASLKKNIAEVKALANGKPLVATEWNARGNEGNKGAWADAIQDFWPTIRDNFYAAYYFAAVRVNTMAGPAGVINANGSPNGEFYSAYKSLKNAGGGGQVDTPSTPTRPTTPTTPAEPTGVRPDSTGKPSVGAFRIFDAVTGKAVKGYENVTSGQTIKLSSLAHRQIQIRALTTSNASSVKFGFTGRATRTENTAPFTAFANSRGAETSWTAVKGKFTLSATGYTQDNASGVAGKTLSLILNFI